MKKKKGTVKIFFTGIFLLASLVTLANGQEYPSRSIECLVGYPPGGVSDTTFRVLCKAAEKHLGQPLIVVNKPGVSGALSMDYLVNQKPDGYNLSYSTGGMLMWVRFFEKVTYTPDDFSYIMGFGYMLQAISVKADASWNSFREFLNYAKKNPGKVKYASFSPVSTTSIQMDMIAEEEGIDWIHTPYKGDSPGITALLGGHVDAYAGSSGQVPYIRSGNLKCLAIFNTYPSKSFPNIPTVKSLGYKFPMFSDITTTQGVIGPKGMDPKILKKLQDAFIKAAKDPSFIKTMESLDNPMVIRDGEEYKAEILRAYQICEKVLPPIAAKRQK